MPRFKPYNYDQNVMVVINYRDPLQTGTFEHAIHFLVDKKLDLSIFDPHFSNDDGGRPVYDPAILLKIVLFGNLANKGLNRFSLRSKRKLQSQWQLYCLVHNIENLKNYGNLGR